MLPRLKIAWTVFFAVLTVALCVLWVRSYWRIDRTGFLIKPLRMFAIDLSRGTVEFQTYGPKQDNGWGTFYKSVPQRYTATGRPLVSDAERRSWRWETNAFSLRSFLTIPYWFVVFVAGLLTALPWIISSLPYRFSLRTMLIVTTLVAVVLVLIAYAGRG